MSLIWLLVGMAAGFTVGHYGIGAIWDQLTAFSAWLKYKFSKTPSPPPPPPVVRP